MRRKSEAVGMLNEFLDDVKQMNKSPKHMTIKSDAEAVYIEGVFRARCRELGINTVNSPPYVHEQNGNAEKLFRDLGEMARSTMAASGFPATAWLLAYRHGRIGCGTACLRRASTGRPPTFACTGYPASSGDRMPCSETPTI
eukprot:1184539-Prorocentrum_minimum.AAC.1